MGAEVLTMMNKLTKVEAISGTMRAMQEEMTKAGVIEEMVDGAFEALDEEGDEEAADEEVEKVFQELAFGATSSLASASAAPVAQQQQEDDDEEDMSAMRERLAALKG
jgi:charged multivesicular body protein 3